MAMINPPKSAAPVQDVLQSMFGALSLLFSFMSGTSVVASLLVEEKEKKTLRMLMVSPATFADVVMAKLLVGLGYQLLLTIGVALILQTLTGNVPLLFVFIMLGSCLALSIGLIAGCIFQTNNAVGVFNGIGSMLFFIPGFFAGGALGNLFQNTPTAQVMKFIPTYYLSDGVFKALSNQGWNASVFLDVGIILGCTIVLFALASWLLRRQASVVALI
jgi:ABC-2 type transport system permease protein